MALSVWFGHRVADTRYALRGLARTPGMSAAVILSLALGIGGNTAVFSLLDAVLLKRLPVRAPAELYQVAAARRDGGRRTSWDYPDYRAFRDRGHAFSGLAATSGVEAFGLQSAERLGEPAELAQVARVSGNYFEVLGVEPAFGHLFNAADDRRPGGSPYAVLAHDYWQRRYGGDPRVIGRTVRLNGYPFTVVGVVGRGFAGIDPMASPQLFIPIVMQTEVDGVPVPIWNSRHYWWLQLIGRVRDPAAVARAESELRVAYRDQEEAERRASPRAGQVNRQQQLLLQPAATGFSYVRAQLEKPLLVLMAVVAGVLLIACANVASLLIARATARQKEIAVRLALGATRRRIVGQLLVESLLLALLGGAAGLLVAYGAVSLLLGAVPQIGWSQSAIHVSPDLRLLAFTFAVSLATGVLFGLAPALQATRPDLVPALKEETPSVGAPRITLRKALVVVQVALSLLLLAGAGLFARSLANLRDVDPGFRPERTVTIAVDPTRNGYKGQRLREFYERLRAEVERAPGVRSVSLAEITPLAGMRWNGDISVEGYRWKKGEPTYVDMNAVGPRFFETMGIPIVLGRDFRDEYSPPVSLDPPEQIDQAFKEPELPGRRVTIVTESMARRFFSGRNAIGLHLCLSEEYDPARAYEIVGVVKDARYFGLREAAEPMLYLPVWRAQARERAVCVRTTGDPLSVSETVRRKVSAIDPAVPVLRTRTMQEFIDRDIIVERLVAALSGCFGLLAALLAGIGLYGVISQAVSGRTREIGVRVALGAAVRDVIRLVLTEGAVLVVAGLAIGLLAAAWTTRLVRSLLFGVAPGDPATFAIVSAVVAAVALIASYLPARRAAKVDPVTALRHE